MIERDQGFNTFEVSCDECPEATEIDTDGDWSAMIAELKEHGWSIRKDADDEWTHICPACVEADPFDCFPS